MPAKKNLVGKTFGRLTIVAEAPKSDGRVRWLARCECGRTTTVITGNLNNGHTKGCGYCTHAKHYESRSALYAIWQARVCCKHGCCDQWRTYEPFREWARANGWKQGLWVHRKADTGEYSPDNCFIAPRRCQAAFGQSKKAKLLPADIPVIRQLHSDGWTREDIGRRFNANQATIYDVIRGKTWVDIDDMAAAKKRQEATRDGIQAYRRSGEHETRSQV